MPGVWLLIQPTECIRLRRFPLGRLAHAQQPFERHAPVVGAEDFSSSVKPVRAAHPTGRCCSLYHLQFLLAARRRESRVEQGQVIRTQG